MVNGTFSSLAVCGDSKTSDAGADGADALGDDDVMEDDAAQPDDVIDDAHYQHLVDEHFRRESNTVPGLFVTPSSSQMSNSVTHSDFQEGLFPLIQCVA